MVSGFICGTSSFPREEDDYERQTRSADSSPKRARTKNNNKNPYSTRGLDKFSALLAEIEEKRRQIYSRVDPDEISLVRFVYSGDDEVKPIVVKAKHKVLHDNAVTKQQKSQDLVGEKANSKAIKKLHSSKSMNHKEDINDEIGTIRKNKKSGFRRRLSIKQWKESMLVLPMILILILVFLVVFGRSFTIMCTSIGWYVIPNITHNKNAFSSNNNNSKASFKKNDYAIRRLSEKKLMAMESSKSFKT